MKAQDIERKYIPSQGNIYSESLHAVRRRDEAYTCQTCDRPSEVSTSDLSAACRITLEKEAEMVWHEICTKNKLCSPIRSEQSDRKWEMSDT